jgi:diacylglycerol kinase family enzyme
MDNSSQKVFVIFNPSAGKEAQATEVRAALAQHFVAPQWTPEIYETPGQVDEDVTAICRAACARGASLVVAADGDGTLIGVANGLVHSPVPLEILPLAATRSVHITADRSHLVQADGEVIERTPIEVQLVLKAIHVIMPNPALVLAAN